MKTLNGFEIVDAQAREDIEVLKNTEVDLNEYAKKSEIPDVSGFITSIPSEYITETELNAKGYLTEHQDISGKADKVHSHPEYLTEHQSLAGYATENYVDNAIASIEIPEVIPTDGIKAVFIDASSVGGSSSAIPEEYISVFQKYASGEDRDVYFFIKLDGKTYFQPESIYMPSDTMLSIDLPVRYHAVNNPGQLYKTSLTIRLDYSPASWWINTSYNNLATKKYVDDAIENIDIPESSGGGKWVWESNPCYVSAHDTKHMRLVFEDNVDTNIVTLSVSTYLSNFAENTSKVYRVPNLLGHTPDGRDEYSAYLEFRINNNQLVLYDDYGYEITDWYLIGYYYWQE